MALVAVACWPITLAIVSFWQDDHLLGGRGAFAAALALWLVYRARSAIGAASAKPLPWAILLLLAVGVAAMLLGKAGATDLQAVILPALVLLMVLALYGPAVARVVAVPVGFLFLAMPVWDERLAPLLQRLTLSIVKWLAPTIGIPASVSGSLVSLPGGMSFEIVRGCSGLGFLVEGLAVAALLGELEGASVGRRLALLAAIVPVALATNWVRVLTLIEVGYASGMRHVLVTRHHLLFGYVLFVLVLVAFLWIATWRSAPRAREATVG